MVQASAQQLELVLVQEWVLQQVLAVREREQVPQQGLEQEQEPEQEPEQERVRRQTHRRLQ